MVDADDGRWGSIKRGDIFRETAFWIMCTNYDMLNLKWLLIREKMRRNEDKIDTNTNFFVVKKFLATKQTVFFGFHN